MNVVLFGFKGCGKTRFGAMLAERTGRTFIDVDRVIEALYYHPALGRPQELTCAQIYRAHGEEFFRALERDAVRKTRLLKNAVIATGGGAVIDYYNYFELKRNGRLIYLKTPKVVLKQRLLSMNPLPGIIDPADPAGSFDRLYKQRAPVYDSMAEFVVDMARLSDEEVLQKLCELCKE